MPWFLENCKDKRSSLKNNVIFIERQDHPVQVFLSFGCFFGINTLNVLFQLTFTAAIFFEFFKTFSHWLFIWKIRAIILRFIFIESFFWEFDFNMIWILLNYSWLFLILFLVWLDFINILRWRIVKVYHYIIKMITLLSKTNHLLLYISLTILRCNFTFIRWATFLAIRVIILILLVFFGVCWFTVGLSVCVLTLIVFHILNLILFQKRAFLIFLIIIFNLCRKIL